MKIYKYIIGIVSIFSLTACNDWLDIQPQDTTVEEQLFETGDGFRNALNGVYRQMAGSNMYGKTLTWGGLDAMAQYYSPKYGTGEYYFARYDYGDDIVTNSIKKIWSEAYNNIANCNNLIQRIEKEPITTFAQGEEERDLIHGEALALRAILHFDMYRLFAPAKEDGKSYLPYVDVYPCTFKEYVTSKELLAKATDDLKAAKELVGRFDIPRAGCLKVSPRFENDYQQIPASQLPTSLFFTYRGYRLNYYAICGMLARVYLYRGMYKEAFDETEIVVNAVGDTYNTPLFSFTNTYEATSGKSKMYDEILFCLSNQKLLDNYNDYRSNEPLYLSTYSPSSDWFARDPSDVRSKLITVIDRWYYCSTKYQTAEGRYNNYQKDMIPMLRLGEIYYIRAEYYNQAGNKEQSVEEFAKVRRGHGCTIENVNSSDADWFNKALLDEARREFIGEGQLFYYYKRLGKFPSGMTKEEQFVLPYPQNEIL